MKKILLKIVFKLLNIRNTFNTNYISNFTNFNYNNTINTNIKVYTLFLFKNYTELLLYR